MLTRERLLEMFEEQKNEFIKNTIIPGLYGDPPQVVVNSLDEFIQRGGEKRHYYGRAMYSWQNIEFPNDYEGRVPPSVIRTFFRCGDHPVVTEKKKELEKLLAVLEKAKKAVWDKEVEIFQFEKGKK